MTPYTVIKEMSSYSLPSKKQSFLKLETGVSKYNIHHMTRNSSIDKPPKQACCSHFGHACYFLCENFSDK